MRLTLLDSFEGIKGMKQNIEQHKNSLWIYLTSVTLIY